MFEILLFFFNILIYKCINICVGPNKDISRDWSTWKRWKYKNVCTSLVHALIATMFSTASVLYKMDLLYNLIEVRTELSAITLISSAGYFFWDTFDLLSNEGFRQWPSLLHHGVVSCNNCFHFYQSSLKHFKSNNGLVL